MSYSEDELHDDEQTDDQAMCPANPAEVIFASYQQQKPAATLTNRKAKAIGP